MKRKLFLFMPAALLLFINPGNPAAGREKRPREVVILHVNDMHSRIDNLGKLAYFADSVRNRHRHVFLVSAGDNFTGNPIVDMYPEVGFPMIDLMNRMDFDLSAMGNHEFDMGQETQNKRRREAKFPFICANMDTGNSLLHPPLPYVILRAGRIKIPFLGLLQLGDKGLPDSHPSRLEGLVFTPPLETAGEYRWLKDKYGILVGLTHLGVEGDEPLAQQYPFFDVILGGHSHTTMTKPMMVNGVMIVQTGSGVRYVGKTTLRISGRKITGREYELIPLERVAGTHPEIQQLIDGYNSNEEMNRVVGHATSPIRQKDELGSLMTDAITHQFGLDFAFQNSGGIRIPFLPQGDITLKDVFRLDPFGNQVVTLTMTLEEIKSLIQNSYNRDKEVDLMVSGMKYTILTDENGLCTGVDMTDFSGNPFDPAKKYKVGMNSYIAASYRFDHEDPGTTNYETSARTLIDYLQEVKSVNYSGIRRTDVKKPGEPKPVILK